MCEEGGGDPRSEQEFQEDGADRPSESSLVVDLDGYEGPLDLLVSLAREQKVDLRGISIVQLADQYLAFITRAHELRIEIAAEYLVMVCWLLYMKSQLLLPEPPEEVEEQARDLEFVRKRLEAIQDVSKKLMDLPRLGQAFFGRGAPEGILTTAVPRFDVSLYDLLSAYANQQQRASQETYHIEPTVLDTVEAALERLAAWVGKLPDWTSLISLLPPNLASSLTARSVVAASFVAVLELVKQGKFEMRQDDAFTPLYLRAALNAEDKKRDRGNSGAPTSFSSDKIAE